jgi:hypothetical protein
LDRDELFAAALREIDELGPTPADEGAWVWHEERRGSVELLAALAGWNGKLLRRAAIHTTLDERHQPAADLLEEAAQVSALDEPESYRADPEKTYRPPAPRPAFGMLRPVHSEQTAA